MNSYDDVTQAEYYIHECFDLARKYLGRTSPNPVVGAIVLDKNGCPVGRGFHTKAGMEHAEVIALREAGNEKASLGTLIVNLEPCCHYGQTPPCTELIIKSGIKNVIFSNYDPNPLVSGNGEKELIKNNISVVSKVLEGDGLELNKFFFKWIKNKKPWITLKQAQTLDGKVGIKNKSRAMISSDLAKKEVHELRNIYDAILIGASTVKSDDPELTVRDISGGKSPIRIVLDRSLITSPMSKVYRDNAPVYLVVGKGIDNDNGNDNDKSKLNDYLKFNGNINIIEAPLKNESEIDLGYLFSELGKKEILSILVEAGPRLASELIYGSFIDEYILFISPRIFGGSETIPALETRGEILDFRLVSYKKIGNDLMLSLSPKMNK